MRLAYDYRKPRLEKSERGKDRNASRQTAGVDNLPLNSGVADDVVFTTERITDAASGDSAGFAYARLRIGQEADGVLAGDVTVMQVFPLSRAAAGTPVQGGSDDGSRAGTCCGFPGFIGACLAADAAAQG